MKTPGHSHEVASAAPPKPLIRLSKSVLDEREAEAVRSVILEDGYLGMGRQVELFEQELGEFLQTDRNVVCTSSGTAALHLALEALVKPGQEVLVPSLTFVATFQAISAAGAQPVACEVEPETMSIDLRDAGLRITERTAVIVPVHYAGNPGGLDRIYAFASEFHLRVVEDAAHAFGSSELEKRIGSFGDTVCFSFDGIKNITSGEGGAVVTADPLVERYCRNGRLLGVDRDSQRRYQGLRSWEPAVSQQGYRYHMSNLCAAVGRVQLQKFESFQQRRRQLARTYDRGLAGLSGLRSFAFDYDQITPHIYPVRVLSSRRDSLRDFLKEYGIESGVHYFPNHRLEFYQRKGVALPTTDALYRELLSLPLHPGLSDEEQDIVICRIREFLS